MFIKNQRKVWHILENIKKQGPSKLHVIADFDMTLTRYLNSKTKKRNISAHGVFDFDETTPESYKKRQDELFNHYYPIEVSHDLTEAEKLPLMIDWWKESHQLILDLKINRSQMEEIIIKVMKNKLIEWREGIQSLIDWLEKHKIPILVFSAGLGDVIEVILKHDNLYSSKMHVISNRIKFSESGDMIDFYEPMIHIYNKNEFTATIQTAPIDETSNDLNPNLSKKHSESIKRRTNVILMGDSLGDIRMGEGIAHESILSFGFFNRYIIKNCELKAIEPNNNFPTLNTLFKEIPEEIEWVKIENPETPLSKEELKSVQNEFEEYLKTFDIVLVGDLSFDHGPMQILSELSGK